MLLPLTSYECSRSVHGHGSRLMTSTIFNQATRLIGGAIVRFSYFSGINKRDCSTR